jgi:hypothetical protein
MRQEESDGGGAAGVKGIHNRLVAQQMCFSRQPVQLRVPRAFSGIPRTHCHYRGRGPGEPQVRGHRSELARNFYGVEITLDGPSRHMYDMQETISMPSPLKS